MQATDINWQIVLNIGFSLSGALGGWILSTMWKEIKDARDDHAELLKTLPETYARRDDMAGALERLENAVTAGFNRLYDKIDGKADRPHRP